MIDKCQTGLSQSLVTRRLMLSVTDH